MIALLHYAFLKSWRDRSLPAFTLFTAGTFLMTRIAISAVGMIRGQRIVDDFFYRDLPTIAAVSSAMMAGLAGFWTLRLEIADRSIGSFVLAARSVLMAAAITVYAACVGFSSFLFAIPITGIRVPPEVGSFGNLMLLAACSSVVAGAFGLAMATISPEPPMVVPTWIGVIAIIIATFELIEPVAFVGSIILLALLLTMTSLLLERRCAA
ncbi:MAG TPA: hypothetical protein VNL91_05880 [Thermoanaerobaculia bacterium]|nr:hypothetical protein [Thermoanaerobaculia bacterium]